MLTLTIKAANYNELRHMISEAAPELFELSEAGYFDDEGDEWVYNSDTCSLDYELD